MTAGVALLAGIVAYGLFAVGPSNVQGGVGPAPDVTLHTDQGALPLASTRGKILVLYFSFPG